MNAIGQLFLFVFTGGAYLLLFVTIAPLIAKILQPTVTRYAKRKS